MTPDDWAHVKQLFSDLVDATASDRHASLEGLHPEVRRQVEGLLENHDAVEASGSILAQSLIPERMADWLLEPKVFIKWQRLGERFEITGLVGRGGMGEVYEAIDHHLREPVAIKTIRFDLAGNETVLERFRGEVQRSRKVTHPSVCRVHDLFSAQGLDGRDVPFLTMEFLRGPTLYEYVAKRGSIAGEEASTLGAQICEGLFAAHQCGVIHRDLKSSNIIVMSDASERPQRAKITDFGLARIEGIDSEFVSSAAHSGTLPYMAPELLDGRPATTASDIYALGVVLHRIITGSYPLVYGQAGPSETLPPQWNLTISACMDPAPSRRPKSARDVAGMLAGKTNSESNAGISRRTLFTAAALSSGGLIARNWYARLPLLKAAESKMLVEDFESPDTGSALGRAARNIANLGLRGVPGLKVVEPKELKASNAALDLGTQSLRGPTALRVAGNLGANLTVAGQISRNGSGIQFKMRATRVKDSVLLATVEEPAGSQGELAAAVVRACGRMSQQLFGISPVGETGIERADSKDPEALELFTAGLNYYENGDMTAAHALLESATRLDPEFALAFVYRAYCLSAMLRDDLAYPIAQRAFVLRDRVSERQRRQAEAIYYSLCGDYTETLKAQRALVAMFPNEAPLHRHVAQMYSFLDRAEEGIIEGRIAVDLDPKPLNFMILASTLAQAGRLEQARAVINEGRKATSNSPMLSLSETFVKLQEDDVTGALAIIAGLSRRREMETQGRSREAQCLIFAGRLLDGQRILESEQVRLSAVGDTPNEDVARYLLGLLLALWGSRKEALAQAAALVSRPAVPPSLNSLRWGAEVAAEVNGTRELAGSLERIRAVHAAHPSNHSSGVLLQVEGLAAGNVGDTNTLLRRCRDACSAWPDLSNRWALASALMAKGEHREALESYRNILARKGAAIRWQQPIQFVRSHAQLGRCYRAVGLKTEAMESYTQFLSSWGTQSTLPLVRAVTNERV